MSTGGLVLPDVSPCMFLSFCKNSYSPWKKVAADREDELARLDGVPRRHVARIFFSAIQDLLALPNPDPSRISENLQF